MVLKDWKKSSSGVLKWYKKDLTLSVNYAIGDDKKWYVSIGTASTYRKLHKKGFKSKSQALKFAKEYMRRN